MLRIIKIGTKVMTRDDGTLDREYLAGIVSEVAGLMRAGEEVVIVTSGAGGAGKSTVALSKQHGDVVRKQIYAAVGQPILMAAYIELFAQYGLACAQVLASREDFSGERLEHLLGSLRGFLTEGIVAIVNENDVVAIRELMFTDNDELAMLLTGALKADHLLILTSPEGVLDPGGKTIPEVSDENVAHARSCVTGDVSENGRGGMLRKFDYARECARAGFETVIARGRTERVVTRIAQGERLGTRFVPASR